MSKDFPDIPSFNGEETVIGYHSSGIQLEEGLNTSLSRNYCANCKRKIHCYVKVDRETGEATVHNTCKSSSCECKCKSHYACKQCGYLHAYGTKCNRVEFEHIPNSEAEKRFQELMEKWSKHVEK